METTILFNKPPAWVTAVTNVGVVPKDVSNELLLSQNAHANTVLTLAEPVEAGERRRKKRNRWGDAAENKAAGLMGLPTMIKANMTNEQLEAYTLHLRIQEISEKLRINDVVPADGDR